MSAKFPTSTNREEPGLDAVRGRYGDNMVQRFRNWPLLAENYCRAQNGDDVMVAEAVSDARRNLDRARRDRDYALSQADAIARSDVGGWDLVPSVAQLRREWWP
jgi:hypothetical protein